MFFGHEFLRLSKCWTKGRHGLCSLNVPGGWLPSSMSVVSCPMSNVKFTLPNYLLTNYQLEPFGLTHLRFDMGQLTTDIEGKNKGAGNFRRPFGRRKGTLTLRSWLRSWFAPFGSRLCSQFTNGSRDISAVDFPVLNRHTRTRCQITRTLRFRIDCESDLLRLAANLLGNDQLIRIDRSDRTLGEMCSGLGCFRLG